MKIPFPPLPEQQKISSILSKVDEQIEQTEQIIEKTELLKKGLMQKLLTKGIGHTKFKKTELGEIPEEWEIVELEKCVRETIKDGTHSTPKYVDDRNSLTLVLQILDDGKINFDTCKKITLEEHAELSKRYKTQKKVIFY